MHIDFISMCRQVIARLTKEIGTRNHRLARFSEFLQRCSDAAQLTQSTTQDCTQLKMHSHYAIVSLCESERIDDILDQRLWRGIIDQLSERPIIGIAIQLIDQRPYGLKK